VSRCRILVSECAGFSAEAAAVLRTLGELRLADLDRETLLSSLVDVDVLWGRLRHRIDAPLIAAAPRLKAIVSPTTGLNHIDVDAAAARGVAVLSLRGETAFLNDVVATAEHTLALTLALLRHLPAAMRHTAVGGWDRDPFKGREVRGRTIGVVGYGRLGRIVGRYFTALGARVVVADPAADAESMPPGIELVSLAELLRRASVVTLHVNLTSRTRQFFGAREFAAMANGAWFINTSRGELIDEAALLNALETGHLAGAALDVLGDESSSGMGHHPLVHYARSHDNLIVTPHLGGCTEESMDKTERFLAQRLKDFLTGAKERQRACAE
jgi:D-3-phosphoglycerate dehydrogenase